MERIDPVDRCAHEQRVKSVTSDRPCRTSPHSILASGGPARLAWLAVAIELRSARAHLAVKMLSMPGLRRFGRG